jgi:hypothetical protein
MKMNEKLDPLDSAPITACQNCGHATLRSLLFLGYVPPVNTMPVIGSAPDVEMRFPLELARCDACTLVQISYRVDARILFPESYPYLSGTTRILRDNFKDLAREAGQVLGLASGDLVIDIGANDGTLLTPFREAGQRVLGIEPSQAADKAAAVGIEMIKDYFCLDLARQVAKTHGAARLVTAANVFAHISDVHAVVDGITCLMNDDSVFISESHYLGDLIRTLQYDTVYHEHLRYYSVGVLVDLLARHDLEIFRVTRIPTHGGSVRVYAGKTGSRVIDRSVREILDEEEAHGIRDGSALKKFRDRVLASKLDLLAMLRQIKSEGGRIYGISAPSRASTLINYCGLDDGILSCVLETSSSHKIDHFIPGTRIPVLDERKLFEDQPEFALILAWHIADELAPLLRRKGFKGRFISPLPSPRFL